MYIVPPSQATYTLFSSAGKVRTYASKSELLKSLGLSWIAGNVGPHFRVFREKQLFWDTVAECWSHERHYKSYAYVLRGDHGQPIVESDVRPPRKYKHYYRGFGTWNGEGPVPNTGRRYRGHYYRHPETIALKRDAQDFSEYGEPPVRAKRKANLLPSAWDDYARQDVRERSWKRHRTQQWKGAPRAQ